MLLVSDQLKSFLSMLHKSKLIELTVAFFFKISGFIGYFKSGLFVMISHVQGKPKRSYHSFSCDVRGIAYLSVQICKTWLPKQKYQLQHQVWQRMVQIGK